MAEKQLTKSQENTQWDILVGDAKFWTEKLKENNNIFISFSNFCRKPKYQDKNGYVYETNQCVFEWKTTINIPINPIKIHTLQFLFKNNEITPQVIEDFWCDLAVYKYYFSTYQGMKKYIAEFILELDKYNFFKDSTKKISFNDWVTFGIKKNDMLMFLSKYDFVDKLIKIIQQPFNSVSKIYDVLLLIDIVNTINNNQENKRYNIVEKYSNKIHTNIKNGYKCSFLNLLNEQNANEFISIDKGEFLKQIKKEYIKIRNCNFESIFNQIFNWFKTNKFNNLLNVKTHKLLNDALSKQIDPNIFINGFFELVEFCNCNDPYLIPLIYDEDVVELKQQYIQFFDKLNKNANDFRVADAKKEIKDYFGICQDAKKLNDFAHYVDAIRKLLCLPNFCLQNFESLHNCYKQTFWSENDREKRSPFHQWELATSFIVKHMKTLNNDQNRDKIKLFAENAFNSIRRIICQKNN